jgi:Ser/Thr protein kinase RdoA (MazF antagonist)
MKAALMAQQFDVAGRLVTAQYKAEGNVNDTYLVIFRTTFSEERFVLQRINTHVFNRPEQLMANMRVVTDHVHRRLEADAHLTDRIWQLPRVIPAKDGRDFAVDADGGYWRAISLIASAHAYERVQSMEHAHEAGVVLGQFQRLISDLDIDELYDPLEGFHITPGYLAQLDHTLATEEAQRRLEASPEARQCLRAIEKRRDWASVLEDARGTGRLGLRPIHGDPKVANIMIDDMTAKGTAIIDLDTVKPGLIHYDFGDCIRSCCNPAGEEASDLRQVFFDTDLCHAIVTGYMTYAREFLTDTDHELLYDAIRLIAFELGVRFFADHLAGDVYFKVKHEGHNLQRARVQLKLTESIETREPVIRKLLEGAR